MVYANLLCSYFNVLISLSVAPLVTPVSITSVSFASVGIVQPAVAKAAINASASDLYLPVATAESSVTTS